MSEVILSQPMALPARVKALPAPKTPIDIRPATAADIPFIDALQKANRKAVGFMPAKWLEEKMKSSLVLIAHDTQPLGYVIGNDRYFKRDDCGIIYQMNVVERARRMLVGATLLKNLFERSAYGCRLYCCWCAQDLSANRFWESLGFVPLAFRTGGRGGSRLEVRSDSAHPTSNNKPPTSPRVHIFWQKRIRAGDTTTPWWFPSKTDAGMMREDRVVLPIPLDRHWSDEMPRLLPAERGQNEIEVQREPRKRKQLDMTPPPSDGKVHSARQFDGPPAGKAPIVVAKTEPATAKPEPTIEKAKPLKKPKTRTDTRLIAAARELKDRWLEQMNANAPEHPCGKYDVTRQIDERTQRDALAIDGTVVPRLAA